MLAIAVYLRHDPVRPFLPVGTKSSPLRLGAGAAGDKLALRLLITRRTHGLGRPKSGKGAKSAMVVRFSRAGIDELLWCQLLQQSCRNPLANILLSVLLSLTIAGWCVAAAPAGSGILPSWRGGVTTLKAQRRDEFGPEKMPLTGLKPSWFRYRAPQAG